MRPTGLTSKIFLDSGDPAETRAIIACLGFLDGQTTNPTLVAKNPYAKGRFDKGDKFSSTEIITFYQQVVCEIEQLIPQGSVSIEVYADENTPANEMFQQGQEMNSWIPNAHIKYPIIAAGLAAAEQSIKAKMRVNMTLCFSQAQAAAVYAATAGAAKGDVFISPFIGRLEDIGNNGLDLIANIVKMYQVSDNYVAVLAASVRTMEHFMRSLALGADIITAPFHILKEWGEAGQPLPSSSQYTDEMLTRNPLKAIPYQQLDLQQPWQSYDISHELTTKGVQQFAADWNALIN